MRISILIPSKDEPKVHLVVDEIGKTVPAYQSIVCNDTEGKGKGWAVRQGIEVADGDVIGIIDGDMDIHPRMFNRLIPYLEDYDIVVGKKQVRGSLARRLLTRLTRVYTYILFGLNYDTQTGIKLFKDYAVFKYETDSYAFDIEMLAKARQKGMSIIEVPVEVTDMGSSAKPMRISNVIRALRESLKIRRRLFGDKNKN